MLTLVLVDVSCTTVQRIALVQHSEFANLGKAQLLLVLFYAYSSDVISTRIYLE